MHTQVHKHTQTQTHTHTHTHTHTNLNNRRPKECTIEDGISSEASDIEGYVVKAESHHTAPIEVQDDLQQEKMAARKVTSIASICSARLEGDHYAVSHVTIWQLDIYDRILNTRLGEMHVV